MAAAPRTTTTTRAAYPRPATAASAASLLRPLLLVLALAAAAAAAAPLGFASGRVGGIDARARAPRHERRRGLFAAAAATAGGAEGGGASATEPPTAVVIVPGYASDASQYRRLEASFHQRGIPAWTVPLASLMWAPTFGGRSIRPILDRLHSTVLDVALHSRPLPPSSASDAAVDAPWAAGRYSTGAFLQEMADPSQGARFPPSQLPLGSAVDPPPEQAFGDEALRYRVALVAHSAGGWISRLYLSTATYDGRAYNGARFVSSLITLGSPHVFPPRFRGAEKVPYALRNLQFVTDRCTGPAGGDWERRVRCVCVGSRTLPGGTALGGLVKDWAGYSYEISGYGDEEEDGAGPVWGDGITPLASALGLPGAVARVELEGVHHGPEAEDKGLKWYGSDPDPLERWLGYVLPDPAQWPSPSAAASSSSGAPAAPAAAAKAEGR